MSGRRVRTPEQIIGKDALIQLVFEGYDVTPTGETLDALAQELATRANQIWEELEDTGSDGENKSTYRALARKQLVRPWHSPSTTTT